MKDFESLRFIENQENIVFLSSSGVGKTHLAVSIGVAAAKKRYSTYFVKCHDLILQLKRAKLENRLDARQKHFCKYKLLIIDKLGYHAHVVSINGKSYRLKKYIKQEEE